MSSFEEQFPELKERLQENKEGPGCMETILTSDIEKFCLSKSKVKEAIKKYKYPIMFETTMDENGMKKSVPIEFRVDVNVLLKELSLEEE